MRAKNSWLRQEIYALYGYVTFRTQEARRVMNATREKKLDCSKLTVNQNTASKTRGFPTQRPLFLMSRVILQNRIFLFVSCDKGLILMRL